MTKPVSSYELFGERQARENSDAQIIGSIRSVSSETSSSIESLNNDISDLISRVEALENWKKELEKSKLWKEFREQ